MCVCLGHEQYVWVSLCELWIGLLTSWKMANLIRSSLYDCNVSDDILKLYFVAVG